LRTLTLTLALAAATLAWSAPSGGSQTPGQELDQHIERLMKTYVAHKQLGTDWRTAYNGLRPDRRAVFDAAVRALFLQPMTNQVPIGERLVHYVKEVRGIWGVRTNDGDGRKQFRLSLLWDAKVVRYLEVVDKFADRNMDKSENGHVLMPGPDDQGPTAVVDLRGPIGVRTYRQRSVYPKLQLSFLEPQLTTGEVDVDFDSGCVPLTRACHCKPSNSDVGSFASADNNETRTHLALLNASTPFLPPLPPSTWNSGTYHCEEVYK
jgi:hypothetical protein